MEEITTEEQTGPTDSASLAEGPAEAEASTRAEAVVGEEPGGSSSGYGALGWLLQGVREIGETVIPAVVIALFINLFLAQATQVLGQSMEPTLHSSQRVVIEKVSYRLHGPRRGDIVVIDSSDQSEMLIKRVVGLPGETVEVKNGRVSVNGELLEEPWTVKQGGGHFGPQTVPPLHVFVLGDNRGASNDSRNFGAVPIDDIVGQAWISYWPPGDVGFVE
ncbi:MAG: signal peptidase I [Anaerolineae bacterium]|jgi:signal peptidase I